MSIIPFTAARRVGECDCRHGACAVLRLTAIVRDTIRSTCGSYRLSAMISYTSSAERL